jgi:hypothetical protein
MFTLDHKRIGVMYLVSVLASFFVGGLFALIVRTKLLTPVSAFVCSPGYIQGSTSATNFVANLKPKARWTTIASARERGCRRLVS